MSSSSESDYEETTNQEEQGEQEEQQEQEEHGNSSEGEHTEKNGVANGGSNEVVTWEGLVSLD